jgi:hypothetical protein
VGSPGGRVGRDPLYMQRPLTYTKGLEQGRATVQPGGKYLGTGKHKKEKQENCKCRLTTDVRTIPGEGRGTHAGSIGDRGSGQGTYMSRHRYPDQGIRPLTNIPDGGCGGAPPGLLTQAEIWRNLQIRLYSPNFLREVSKHRVMEGAE